MNTKLIFLLLMIVFSCTRFDRQTFFTFVSTTDGYLTRVFVTYNVRIKKSQNFPFHSSGVYDLATDVDPRLKVMVSRYLSSYSYEQIDTMIKNGILFSILDSEILKVKIPERYTVKIKKIIFEQPPS